MPRCGLCKPVVFFLNQNYNYRGHKRQKYSQQILEHYLLSKLIYRLLFIFISPQAFYIAVNNSSDNEKKPQNRRLQFS